MVVSTSYGAWVRCPKPNPRASLRLFCFPYSGGSASSFQTWEQSLPIDIEVCSIQLPGRENRFREAPFTKFGPLMAALEESLLSQLTLPFAFFGHSLGAMICFELTRQLRRDGYPLPVHLFASSHRAPQLPHIHEAIHHMSDEAFTEELRTYNGTPESVLQNKELIKLLLPAIRADFTLYETYRYTEEPPLKCPITVFGGEQDPKVSRATLAQWRVQTESTFMLHMFPGDHFFLHSHKELLLHKISQELVSVLNRLHE